MESSPFSRTGAHLSHTQVSQTVKLYGICSSGFSVRKALSALELASTTNTHLQVYTIAPDAEQLCTKVLPNSM